MVGVFRTRTGPTHAGMTRRHLQLKGPKRSAVILIFFFPDDEVKKLRLRDFFKAPQLVNRRAPL